MPEDLAIPVLGETTATVVAEAPAPAASEPAQNTGEQAPPAKAEGEKPQATPEQEAKRKQNRLDRKIDRAIRDRAEAQAKADLLERELAAERAKNAPKPPTGKPTLESCEFDPEKYAQATAEWTRAEAAKELEAKQRTEQGKQFHQRLTSEWEKKAARGEEKYEDFHETVGDLQLNSPFVAAIFDTENGDDVAYHLGKNPKEAQRIASLPPMSQLVAIGKLSAKLETEPPKAQTPSAAPAPIKPVGGSQAPATKKLADIDSYEDFVKRREQQVAARR